MSRSKVLRCLAPANFKLYTNMIKMIQSNNQDKMLRKLYTIIVALVAFIGLIVYNSL